MDEMKIESKWTAGIASWIIERVIQKKLGRDVNVQLNNFRTIVMDDKMHVHLDADLELSKEELNKLLKSIGL